MKLTIAGFMRKKNGVRATISVVGGVNKNIAYVSVADRNNKTIVTSIMRK